MGIKDYYSTNKFASLVKENGDPETGQVGHLAEYTLDELKSGIDAKGNAINATKVYYSDGSDAFANRGFAVSFFHVPTSNYVHFKSFINAFNETFSSDWNSESVYGRTDPIRMFKQTTRSITLSLIIPASSEGEAFENLGKVQELLSFLYPTYEDVDNALTVSQSPLIRMRIMNMIRQSQVPVVNAFSGLPEPPAVGNLKHHKQAQKTLSHGAASQGLLGAIRNVSVNHNIDNLEMGSFILADGVIIPKAIEVTLDFDVIHENTLGWEKNAFNDRLFPYGINVNDSNAAGSQAQLDLNQALAAQAAVQKQIDKLLADEEREKKEQMIKNAIAAGYLIAGGVVDGKIEYELTAKGERRKNKISERSAAVKDKKPFNARPYPDEATKSEEAAYGSFLSEFID
tara:strand:+ start:4671 stop:5870 length:1200 start_codon:yes stop_codon:yes gene_type:complete